jgi:NADPH:quinone reductase-like Zn-dependent oxidoreductase
VNLKQEHMTTVKMKAMIATGYGSPGVLELSKIDKPTPAAHEVLVRVHAASATTADAMIRSGKPYLVRFIMGFRKPRSPIPGTGFAGVVEGVGAEVSQFKVGDRVFGETTFKFSASAEYLTINENGVVLTMPNELPFAEAASFCDGHLTSYNFLNELAQLKKGQRILINGASGALGSAAVQIAKYLGAHVTAVCSAKNEGLVKSLGADEVIDYTKQDFTKLNDSFDFVYDTVGKSSFAKSKRILNENGTYLSPVLGFKLVVDMLRTSAFGKKKAVFHATGTNSDQKLRKLLAEVLHIYKSGKLKTIIDRQFPLEKLADAHRYIDSGHKKGNIVMINS